MRYKTAWLLLNKILRAMTKREEAYLLWGKIQIDDAYFGVKRPGGHASGGSKNKTPIVPTISLSEAGDAIHFKVPPTIMVGSVGLGAWKRKNVVAGRALSTAGLVCIRSVTTAGCSHDENNTSGKHRNELLSFAGLTVFRETRKTNTADRFTSSDLKSKPSATSPATSSTSAGDLRWQR